MGFKWKTKVLLTILIAFISSCYSINKGDKLHSFETKRIKSSVGPIKNTKGDVIRGHSIKLHNDSTYVSYINVTKSKLYYSNLSATTPNFNTISLPPEMVNDTIYGMMSSFSVDFDSTIAIFQKRRITVYNYKTGSTIYEKDITLNDSTQVVFQDYAIPIYHDSKKNSIYSQVFHAVNQEKRKFPFDLEFLAQINTSSDTFSFVPLKYPESYNKGELGQNSVMKIAFKGDSIISSSTNEPYISIYDSHTKKITRHAAESSFQTAMKKLPLDALWNKDLDEENNLQSFRYENIFYDDYNKLFYRVYVKRMDLKNESGYYNTFEDRKMGILVLDQDLNKLGEMELPDKKIGWFGVGREGFFYLNSFEINNDTLYKKYVAITPKL
jgi:hypothetical protein